MKNKHLFTHTICIVIAGIIFLQSCSFTERVYRRSELSDPKDNGNIVVMTTQSVKYKLETYVLKDSSIIGTGYQIRDEGEDIPFSGELKYSNIVYIETSMFSFWKTLIVTAGITTFSTIALPNVGIDDPLNIYPIIRYKYSSGDGSGSCPFIYSWNGSEYELEGEAIATAWGRALEMKTRTLLPSLSEENNRINIRITNERPETHYLNSINVIAMESDMNASVHLDSENRGWPVYALALPLTATDHTGNNITAKVSVKDEQYWESPAVGFEDVIELTFSEPAIHRDASLVIHATNTKIFDAVMKMIASIVGDHTLEFVQAIENDPELISILKEYLAESSLKASLWNGTEWEPIGAILPEANEVPFSRILRFNSAVSQRDTVKIRLTCMADVWKLDAIGIEWKSVESLKTFTQPIFSADASRDNNITQTIEQSDEMYSVLFPSDKIDLTFRSVQPPPGRKITYALDVQGYIHEWFPTEKNNTYFEFVHTLSGDVKLSFIKNLVKQKSLFLSLLYAKWKEMKHLQSNHQ